MPVRLAVATEHEQSVTGYYLERGDNVGGQTRKKHQKITLFFMQQQVYRNQKDYYIQKAEINGASKFGVQKPDQSALLFGILLI